MNIKQEESDFNKFDADVIDNEDFNATDIKINPDFYIHNAIVKSQAALANPNMKEGFLQYRQFIEHIEVLCRAAGRLDKDYSSSIETFKESEEYTGAENESIKSARLANKKLELLMDNIFKNKTIFSSLKL